MCSEMETGFSKIERKNYAQLLWTMCSIIGQTKVDTNSVFNCRNEVIKINGSLNVWLIHSYHSLI